MEDQSPVPYSETTLSLKLSYRHADPDDDDEPALSLGLPEPSSSSSRRPSDHGALRIKREKEASCDEEEEEDGGGARKKLRLSKEQAALLEDKFKEHSTLNPKQKQALARQLKLLPRQVEVWFQNRRARTKLKKIEVEREILRKHCEALREENKRLKKELHELNSTTRFVQSPRAGGAAFVICSSCKKVINDGSVKAEVAKAKPQYSFNNPFARSAAC